MRLPKLVQIVLGRGMAIFSVIAYEHIGPATDPDIFFESRFLLIVESRWTPSQQADILKYRCRVF